MSDSPASDSDESDLEIPVATCDEEFPIHELVGEVSKDPSKLIVVFGGSKMSAIYLNEAAANILDPKGVLGESGFRFTLRDLITVEDVNKFDSTVYPMLKVANRWSGNIGLRDLWGSTYGANCEFRIRVSKTHDRQKYICLVAEQDFTLESSKSGQQKDRDLLLALMSNSGDAVYFKDLEGRFTRASLSLTKRFGLEMPCEVIGKTDFNFFDLDHALPAYEDEHTIIETGKPILNKEEKEIWDDGRVTWAATTKLPLLDRDGNIVGTFGVSRDITERKQSEEKRRDLETKLQLAQKLEAIGSLAAGVAHEINTPTQFVSDNVKFLKDAFSDLLGVVRLYQKICEIPAIKDVIGEDAESILAEIEDADVEYLKDEIPETIEQTIDGLSQISRIVGSMKEFSYPASFDKAGVDLNRAIDNTINVARSEWKYVASVEREFDRDLPEVPCMVDEINQVVLNLVVNAAHAIGAAENGLGKITVRTKCVDNFACIEVSDTGGGVPLEIRDKLFDPFFTTKEVGKGTGQGLPMVRNIVVKNHGGQVDFDSVPGEGATFRVLLPLEVAAEENASVDERN